MIKRRLPWRSSELGLQLCESLRARNGGYRSALELGMAPLHFGSPFFLDARVDFQAGDELFDETGPVGRRQTQSFRLERFNTHCHMHLMIEKDTTQGGAA